MENLHSKAPATYSSKNERAAEKNRVIKKYHIFSTTNRTFERIHFNLESVNGNHRKEKSNKINCYTQSFSECLSISMSLLLLQSSDMINGTYTSHPSPTSNFKLNQQTFNERLQPIKNITFNLQNLNQY